MATLENFNTLSLLFNGTFSNRFFLSYYKNGHGVPMFGLNVYPHHATESARTILETESCMGILIGLWKECNFLHTFAESGACRVVLGACTYKGHKRLEIRLQKREKPNSCLYQDKKEADLNKTIQKFIASKKFQRLQEMVESFNNSLF